MKKIMAVVPVFLILMFSLLLFPSQVACGNDRLMLTSKSFVVCSVNSSILVLYPVADAGVFEYSPNLQEGRYWRMFVMTKVGDNKRFYMKFDISSLPASATIESARLRIYCASSFGQDSIAGVTDIQACRVTDDSWTESGIVWNNQPAYGVVEDTKVPTHGFNDWTVTSWVQNEFSGDKIVSVCFKCVQENYDNTGRTSEYYAREASEQYRPQLVIEYSFSRYPSENDNLLGIFVPILIVVLVVAFASVLVVKLLLPRHGKSGSRFSLLISHDSPVPSTAAPNE